MADPEIKLTRAKTMAFALPAAPLLALSLPPLVFLPPYFVQHLGVNLAAGAGVLLAARVLDIVIDPMLGGWQDRTTHPFGRRRLWMVASLAPLCSLIWLVFIGFQPGVSAIMISLAMLVFYASFSAIMIAHLGWAGELAPDYHGRTKILGAVQLFSAAGQIAILVLPAIAALNGADQAEQVHIMGWFLIVALPLTTLICVASTPERQAAPQAHLTLKQALYAIGVNKALRGVLIADFLVGVSQGVLGGLFLFFVQFKLQFGTLASPLLLLYFVGAFAGVPLWVWLSKKTSKHQALQAATLFTAATVLIIPMLPPGNIRIVAPMILIGGLGNGAPVLLLRSMMVDVIDEDHVKTGTQRAGLFFGLLLTTTKVGQALGPVCYGVLAVFGFNAAQGAANSPQAMMALTLLFAGLPFLLNSATAASLRAYPLNEQRQQELRSKLEQDAAT